MDIRNKVQLITYPDGLGGDLPTLSRVLDEEFPGLFGGIHLLPPVPSAGDRGFAPLTYDEIEPRFGTWDDVRRRRVPVVPDLVERDEQVGMWRPAAAANEVLELG